ncbi:MAG: DUF932 domain-containing protein [Opitutaceae bacterium]|nr:DUF932 domain-containing protein [Cytophagales bacterium]
MKTQQDLNTLYFEVEKVKSSDLFKGHTFVSGIDHTIYAPQSKKILNVCSDKYELVSNHSLFNPIYTLLCDRFGKDMIEVKVQNIEDRKFYVDLIVNNKPFNVQKGDIVCPTVHLHNSYDGTLKFGMAVGFHRLVCTNGMMAFQEEAARNLKHRSGVVNFKELFVLLDNVDSQLERFRKLTDRRLTPKEMEQITELIKEKTDFPKQLIKEVPEVIAREQIQLNTDLTGWLAYHGFNNRLNHADIKMHPEFKEKIDRQVLNVIEIFN